MSARCPEMSKMYEFVEGELADVPNYTGKVLLKPDIDYVCIQFPCQLPAGHDGEHRFEYQP